MRKLLLVAGVALVALSCPAHAGDATPHCNGLLQQTADGLAIAQDYSQYHAGDTKFNSTCYIRKSQDVNKILQTCAVGDSCSIAAKKSYSADSTCISGHVDCNHQKHPTIKNRDSEVFDITEAVKD